MNAIIGIIGMMSFVGVMLALTWSIADGWLVWGVSKLLMRKPSPNAKLVLMLLERPSEWKFDDYHAEHDTGVSMWIANGASFVRASFPTFKNMFGTISSDAHLTIADRCSIWLAYKRCRKEAGRKAPILTGAEKQAVAFAQHIVDHYGKDEKSD